MKLFQRGQQPQGIYLHPAEDSAVRIAAENLVQDVEKVCGVRPAITHDVQEAVIVIGTREHLADAPITWSPVTDEEGLPRWEGYVMQASGGHLYLAGNDRRGAIYAVYDLCARMGVSPWYDLADVPVKEKDLVEWDDAEHVADWPQVKYRGIFLNDEEELDAWARLRGGESTIGPKTYARIFELILRLRGNYIWPAMHVNAFNMDAENGRLAQRMGVVTGTSHCDMLHRSNQNEWKPWVKAKGYEGLQYDYTLPGENRERLMEYWRESLQQNRDCECCYTVGMRGIHDSGFVTAGLEGVSEEELLSRQRALLEEIMAAQRELIAQEIPGGRPPQAFVPYKEVLPIYDSGLNVPEDVTLIWVDDNHGYMRRYPNAQEQKRPGGNGVYYHSSYWAPPGMSYLFLGSIPLAHIGNEMKKCYEQGIQTIWVDNVGALKPLEQETEYFLRCAWDAGREDSVTQDAPRFLREMVARDFSVDCSKMAEISARFAQLSNLCKPEHMRSRCFSQTAYGDEAAVRLNEMHRLTRRAEEIAERLPRREKDAFYELFLVRMQAATCIAAAYYYADRSVMAYDLGAMGTADSCFAKSRAWDDRKRMILHYYNEVLAGGKWQGILTPEDFPPPPLELYPACKPALTIGESKLVLSVPDWGTEGLPFTAPEDVRFFDLMNTGLKPISVTLAATDGVQISVTEGTVRDEMRVMVRMPEQTQGEVTVTAGGQTLHIPLIRAVAAAHLPIDQAANMASFRLIRDIGRGRGDAIETLPSVSPDAPARVHFDISVPQDGPVEVEVLRFLTLNSTGKLRFRVYLDDQMQDVESTVTDEWLGDWRNAAVEDGEKLHVRFEHVKQGTHRMKVEALDPYLTLCGCNVYFAPRQACRLGYGLLNGNAALPDADPARIDRLLGLQCSDVPHPYMVYAGDRFWTQDLLYACNERYRPVTLGKPANWYDGQGHKDIPGRVYGGIVTEADGHLAWETMNALAQSENAWMTDGADGTCWQHRQAETLGRSGLAMWLPADTNRPARENAPHIHYRIHCAQTAVYHIWVLARYDDEQHFGCWFELDGTDVSATATLCRDHFHTYRTVYQWCWQKVITMQVDAGEHVFSIAADKPGTALARVYMTTGDENPLLDGQWQESHAE